MTLSDLFPELGERPATHARQCEGPVQVINFSSEADRFFFNTDGELEVVGYSRIGVWPDPVDRAYRRQIFDPASGAPLVAEGLELADDGCTGDCRADLYALQPNGGGWAVVGVEEGEPWDRGLWLVSERERRSVSADIPGRYVTTVVYPSGTQRQLYHLPPFTTMRWSDDGTLLMLVGELFPYQRFGVDAVAYRWVDGEPQYTKMEERVDVHYSLIAFSPRDKQLLLYRQPPADEADGQPVPARLELYGLEDGIPQQLDSRTLNEDLSIIALGWDDGQSAFYYVTEDQRGITMVLAQGRATATLPLKVLNSGLPFEERITGVSRLLSAYENITFAFSNEGDLAFWLRQDIYMMKCDFSAPRSFP